MTILESAETILNASIKKSKAHREALQNAKKQVPSKRTHAHSMMGRPYPDEFSVQRIRDLTGDIVDNGEYELLRPGVILSSKRHPISGMELHTTSGVLVEDFGGDRYTATALDGVPHGDGTFHPCAGRREIGRLSMELGKPDISIVKRNENVQFIGSEVYMNNPFTGYCEGTCGPHSKLRFPSDDPSEGSIKWIQARWAYMGQGFSERPDDSVCGSAVWNENGQVLGFLRYAEKLEPLKDWCFMVASDSIMKFLD
ncbi:hypothetical protein BDV24DRAFT_157614 [Aspergillus arachidicola]|uniref:Uncharacterized protein n=1 Tax=Aspergillus arachidicola TaxID=656916 RepID=A0A5N6YSE6_9EURO|nr:hypothetical protein BDV24DRAFT_157614 [Aspergillus arachidicola]